MGRGGVRGWGALLFSPFTAKKTQAPGSQGPESFCWLVTELRFTYGPLCLYRVRRMVRNAVCRKEEGKEDNLASPSLLDWSWPLMPLPQQLGFPKVVEIRNEDWSLNRDPYATTAHLPHFGKQASPRNSGVGRQCQAMGLLGASSFPSC